MLGTKPSRVGHATAARFIDPKALARIDNLGLVAKTVVEGFLGGLHRSPYLGLSVDFAEHRAYMPGDDIRRIDWRLFGRTDRFYVKEFEADTNANFSVLLDISRSMDFGYEGITKLDYGRFVAASLLYLSSKQRDRVGLITFDSDIVDFVPPAAKHLDVSLHTLDRVKATRAGNLHTTLPKIAEAFQRQGAAPAARGEGAGRIQPIGGKAGATPHDDRCLHATASPESVFRCLRTGPHPRPATH